MALVRPSPFAGGRHFPAMSWGRQASSRAAVSNWHNGFKRVCSRSLSFPFPNPGGMTCFRLDGELLVLPGVGDVLLK
jgi:hypothetical protein